MSSIFCIFLVLIAIFIQPHGKKPNSQIVDKTNWELFSDSEADISFLHPKNLPVQVTSDSGKEYSLWAPKYDVNYLYSVAETSKPSTTFHLDIRVDRYKPQYPNGLVSDNYTKLAATDKTSFLFNSNVYNYIFLKSGRQWQNQSYVLQCKEQNECRAGIARPNQQFPYLSVVIGGIEGWRNGGNPIDFNSPDYKTVQAIIETLKF